MGSEGAEFQMGLKKKQVCQKAQGGRVQLPSVKGSGEDATALSRGLQDPFILWGIIKSW